MLTGIPYLKSNLTYQRSPYFVEFDQIINSTSSNNHTKWSKHVGIPNLRLPYNKFNETQHKSKFPKI